MKRSPEEFGGGRREPYTTIGIARLLCSRKGCGRRSYATWSGCADGNLQRPLCPECDFELNALVQTWWGDPDAETKLIAYRALLESNIGRPLEC